MDGGYSELLERSRRLNRWTEFREETLHEMGWDGSWVSVELNGIGGWIRGGKLTLRSQGCRDYGKIWEIVWFAFAFAARLEKPNEIGI